MRATIKPASNGRNYGNEKETVDTMRLVAVVAGKLQTVCDARFYMARRSDGASPVYCSLWVHGYDVHTSGHGRATGYGYHKQSAALQDALSSAGITLYGSQYARDDTPENANRIAHIDGVGESAMHAALLAVAVAAGADVSMYCFA